MRVDDEAVTIVRETSDEALRAPVRTDVVPGDDVLAPPASGTAAWADDPGGTWVRTLADLEAGTGQEAAGRITDGAPADPSGLLPLG